MISPPFSILQLPSIKSDQQTDFPCCVVGSNVYLGVSHSSISMISLRPPQEWNAYSVAPGVKITALNVHGESNDDPEIFYATQERKKFFLKKTTGEVAEMPDRISYIYRLDGTILVVFPDLKIEAYSTDLKKKWAAKQVLAKGEEIRYSAQLSDNRFFILSRAGTVTYLTVLSFTERSCTQLMRNVLDVDLSKAVWTHYEDTLFIVSGSIIHSFEISKGTSKNSGVKSDEIPSQILGLSSTIVCLVQGKSVSIIDTVFQAEVSKYTFEDESSVTKLLAYIPSASSILAISDANNLIAFPTISTEPSLLNAIGHGIAKTEKSYQLGFAQIFNLESPSRHFAQKAGALIEDACNEAREILHDLASSKSDEMFFRILSYLKNVPWREAKPEKGSVVYQETDRAVDYEFLREVASLAFTAEGVSPKVPENVCVYLLTHPLFPTSEMPNIFRNIENNPLLYRQAVVTLKGASVQNIIEALSSPADEIFNDAVTRLKDEFGDDQIKAGIKASFGRSQLKIGQLTRLVTRLSSSQDGWLIMAPFIDSIGLFSWDTKLVSQLQKKLARQVAYAENLTQVTLTTEELLRSIDIDVRRGLSLTEKQFGKKSRKGQSKLEEKPTILPPYSVEILSFE